ncbi:hypothetical protein NL676_038920 [Syzygium grande]|nr:hypothetical protein NL676_038920 [Syzygium grande]
MLCHRAHEPPVVATMGNPIRFRSGRPTLIRTRFEVAGRPSWDSDPRSETVATMVGSEGKRQPAVVGRREMVEETEHEARAYGSFLG